MNNILVCLNAVLPMLLIMLVGFIGKTTGLIKQEEISRFNRIAFNIFLPVLLFSNIYNSDIASAFRPKLLIYGVMCVFLSFGIGVVYAFTSVKDITKRSVIIQGVFRSNTAIIGLPFTKALMPDADISSVAVLIAVVVPIYTVLSVVCLEVFSDTKVSPSKIILDILKNPLIIGSTLGIIFLLADIPLPTFIKKTISDMSGVASPLQLCLLGAFFTFKGLRKNISYLVRVILWRLIIIPVMVLIPACLLGFRGVEIAGLLAIFACPTAVNSFTMAQQMHGDAELAGQIVVITSFFCSFTLFAISLLLKNLRFI